MTAAAEARFVPLQGRAIDCELCPPCRARIVAGDKRLAELVELRLLLRAQEPDNVSVNHGGKRRGGSRK